MQTSVLKSFYYLFVTIGLRSLFQPFVRAKIHVFPVKMGKRLSTICFSFRVFAFVFILSPDSRRLTLICSEWLFFVSQAIYFKQTNEMCSRIALQITIHLRRRFIQMCRWRCQCRCRVYNSLLLLLLLNVTKTQFSIFVLALHSTCAHVVLGE